MPPPANTVPLQHPRPLKPFSLPHALLPLWFWVLRTWSARLKAPILDLKVPDVSAFIAACTVCNQNKTPRQAPSGLVSLPVPHRPWSHISLDFVTELPPSDGDTVILLVVNRFSKAAHFIPLPKLPSTKEMAQLMEQHVFRIHGLPVDMVSDRGSHLSSGRHSAPLLGRRPVCHQDSIPKLTISRSEPTKTWRPPYGARAQPNPLPGAVNWSGWSMPRTPFPVLPRDSPLSSAPWGISLHSSLNKRRRSAYPQPRCLSAAVDVPGEEPGWLFSRPTPGIVDKRTVAGPQLATTALGRGYGFPLGICPFR
ncbi:uncharacterized protein LOC135571809 [Oncorhynchus nerka]|uniref:uncharacterized protein LOC135571809 n=1 Tax=Oncorhynchus nerka TaxID=8023 RepID=UPI0031B87ACA